MNPLYFSWLAFEDPISNIKFSSHNSNIIIMIRLPSLKARYFNSKILKLDVIYLFTLFLIISINY